MPDRGRSITYTPIVVALMLLAASGLGCPGDERPEPPSIMRDTSMIDDDVRFTHPYVPGHRTTTDGRVAVQTQGGPSALRFYVFAPEKLGGPILPGPAGPEILADTNAFELPLPPELGAQGLKLGHNSICDPPGGLPGGGSNPFVCGPDGIHDCYDFTLVLTTAESLAGAQFWSMRTHVEVAEPKTSTARIVDASFGPPVQGSYLPLTNEWTEPTITMDGRLLTGRAGGAPRLWTNPNSGETKLRNYDVGYYMLPEHAEACDVTGWTSFQPMSHAPYDAQLKQRYGLATYPFRDTQGALIGDGEDMGGTYPWVDREGKNLFLTGVPGRVVEQSTERFPRRCVTAGCEAWDEQMDWDRGFMVAGLWTHGKLVHLDALINNIDWAMPLTPAGHQRVALYRDAEGADVEVRMGSGRGSSGPFGQRPPGFSGNSNILDSLQHLHNHQTAAQTITPRDVVWVMSTGVGTDEIVFDDYLDPNAFIVSNMQGAITQLVGSRGASLSIPHYWNGQKRALLAPIRVLEELYILLPEAYEEVHLQNAATSLGWKVPAFGFVEAASGRVEPTALGGIKGKGFWLDGQNSIRYEVPAQVRSVLDTDWYLGLHLDPRGAETETRTLARFPDGTQLRLADRTVQYLADGEILHQVALPTGGSNEGWVHLGLRLQNANRRVTLLHDGFPLDRFEATQPLFTMVAGELVLGQSDAALPGFRGWIDEFKVLAHDVNPEVACNHASGTLVRLEGNADWAAIAGAYPAWAHEQVAAAAGQPSRATRYACFHDYGADYGAHLGNVPAGTVAVRGKINFPEGPLRAGAPRPDSSSNEFCLSCHHVDGQGGLTLAALDFDADTPAELDARRQPLQPPPRVFGNVPPHWISSGPGPGSPAEAIQAPAEGLLVDAWVLPNAGAR